ncbi:MAG: pyridoxine 5'-phosphate synthase [Candidatus Margulisbacteria bacterium]|nr:pyridoxine 5'-phosphate synthase [Candidatus Margulisiibacteriota bacterium]
MPKVILGLNIDHVATLRQARKGFEPDPLEAALIAQKAGADLITIHLREDRRHIQDNDVLRIKQAISVPLNLEMAPVPEIVDIALKVKPHKVTLVPEKRQELTTEGGLDVVKNFEKIKKINSRFQKAGIIVSLFIEAQKKQIKASKDSGAPSIELHTGRYAESSGLKQQKELEKLQEAVAYAQSIGLAVHAGHGLNYENTAAVAAIKGIEELNIGHSIISSAVLLGLPQAIKNMKQNML